MPCMGLRENAPTFNVLCTSTFPFPAFFPSLLSGRAGTASPPRLLESLNWNGNTPVFANSMLRGADCVLYVVGWKLIPFAGVTQNLLNTAEIPTWKQSKFENICPVRRVFRGSFNYMQKLMSTFSGSDFSMHAVSGSRMSI
jgi:hypothetical protein